MDAESSTENRAKDSNDIITDQPQNRNQVWSTWLFSARITQFTTGKINGSQLAQINISLPIKLSYSLSLSIKKKKKRKVVA